MNSLRWLVVVALMAALDAPATVYYVDVDNFSPAPPFTNWPTAATNIQDAIDTATNGDLILVTNGIYQTGGRVVYGSLTNRVVINKALTVQSVNGPAYTTIQGYQVPGTTNDDGAVRCVYLTNNAVLIGFTLNNGATRGSAAGDYPEQSGGGAYAESTNVVLSNCVVVANAAYEFGGGIYQATLLNCLVSNNTVGVGAYGDGEGGGAYDSILVNCVISGNMAVESGGGATGGILTNCIVANNSTVSLFAGSTGYGQGGGVNNATMRNCIISNNFAAQWGGGAGGVSTLINCLVTGNTSGGTLGHGNGGGLCNNGPGSLRATNCIISFNRAPIGGGASGYPSPGLLVNCLIVSNTAGNGSGDGRGGGDEGNLLVNCTVVGNSAGYEGGGVDNSTGFRGQFENCVIYDNNCPSNSNVGINCLLYSCSTPPLLPLPLNLFLGAGNITNDPAFVNPAAGDFHLQSNSPCINSGNNAYVANATDLDGNPRIVGGTVDIGAYEFQTPSSVLSYAWAQQYGLPTDGSVDYLDLDGTGFNVYQDWIAGLNPTNPASVLAMFSPVATNNVRVGVTVSWQSVTGHTYFLQRTTSLTAQSAFIAVQTNIVGQTGTTSYTDTTATNAGPYFYRVGVQ